jgi:hypothetical protein
MAVPVLTIHAAPLPAMCRTAGSSVASVYASASDYTHSCVISNANAFRFSRPVGVACSDGDR